VAAHRLCDSATFAPLDRLRLSSQPVRYIAVTCEIALVFFFFCGDYQPIGAYAGGS